MSVYRMTVETVIDIEAESKSEALETFYDGVYEVDRPARIVVITEVES